MNSDACGAPSGTPDVVEQSIMVVCAANVCRSPLMEIALRHALDAYAPARSWRLTSAGAGARPGQPMCSHAATFAKRYPGGTEQAEAHRSKPVSLPMVEEAGLILVASHDQRAAIAALSPSARRRTFTLREAAMMMGRVSTRREPTRSLTSTGAGLLPTLVDLLHEQRGTLAISSGPAHASSRRSRKAEHALDVPDVHQGRGRRHKPAFETIAGDTSDLARGLSRISVPPVESGQQQQQLT